MKKTALLLAVLLGLSSNARAQMPYIEEVKALGAIAGQGLACGSSKYDTFEMLARAILLSKSPSDKLQNEAVYAYSEAKANAYISKQMDGFYECAQIIRRFDQQAIFKAVLYADGTLKMPDGEIITPRNPYDATMIYKRKNKIRENAKAIYDGAEGKVLKVDIKNTPRNEQGIQIEAPLSKPQRVPAPLNEPTIKRISRGR